MHEPAKTIDEVISQLDDIIQASKNDESTLGYFAALYQKVTKTVRDKIGTHYFKDDKRMEKLDVIFANRYLDAYYKYKNGQPITDSWKVAFDASTNQNLIVLQHLLVGMNAHINLDLGIAAAEISNASNIEDLKSDFNKINELLSNLVQGVEDDLAEIWPKLKWILKFLKRADKFIINFSMSIARDGAWKFATQLVKQNSETDVNNLIKNRDLKIAKLTSDITQLSFVERIIFWIIRFGEKGSPSQKITILEQ